MSWYVIVSTFNINTLRKRRILVQDEKKMHPHEFRLVAQGGEIHKTWPIYKGTIFFDKVHGISAFKFADYESDLKIL